MEAQPHAKSISHVVSQKEEHCRSCHASKRPQGLDIKLPGFRLRLQMISIGTFSSFNSSTFWASAAASRSAKGRAASSRFRTSLARARRACFRKSHRLANIPSQRCLSSTLPTLFRLGRGANTSLANNNNKKRWPELPDLDTRLLTMQVAQETPSLATTLCPPGPP